MEISNHNGGRGAQGASAEAKRALSAVYIGLNRPYLLGHREHLLGIDQAIPGRLKDLRVWCSQLDRAVIERSSMFKLPTHTSEPGRPGTFMNRFYFEARDQKLISDLDILDKQRELFPDMLQGFAQNTLSDGAVLNIANLKSPESIARHGESHADQRFVYDRLRSRIVCQDLRQVETTVRELLGNLPLAMWGAPGHKLDEAFPSLVRFRNYFKEGSFYGGVGRPLRMCSLVVAMDQDFCFEVQVMTQDAHLGTKLDHPFHVAKTKTLPEHADSWLNRLLFKISIQDSERYLASSENPANTTL